MFVCTNNKLIIWPFQLCVCVFFFVLCVCVRCSILIVNSEQHYKKLKAELETLKSQLEVSTKAIKTSEACET